MSIKFNIHDLKQGNISLERLKEILTLKIQMIDGGMIDQNGLYQTLSILMNIGTDALYVFNKKEIEESEEIDKYKQEENDFNQKKLLYFLEVLINFNEILERNIEYFKQNEKKEQILLLNEKIESDKAEQSRTERANHEAILSLEQANNLLRQHLHDIHEDAIKNIIRINVEIKQIRVEIKEIKERCARRDEKAIANYSNKIKNYTELLNISHDQKSVLSKDILKSHKEIIWKIQDATEQRDAFRRDYDQKNAGNVNLQDSSWKRSRECQQYTQKEADIETLKGDSKTLITATLNRLRINPTNELVAKLSSDALTDYNKEVVLAERLDNVKIIQKQEAAKRLADDKRSYIGIENKLRIGLMAESKEPPENKISEDDLNYGLDDAFNDGLDNKSTQSLGGPKT